MNYREWDVLEFNTTVILFWNLKFEEEFGELIVNNSDTWL
jgi:hypothetical protein